MSPEFGRDVLQSHLPIQGQVAPEDYGIAVVGQINERPVKVVTGAYTSTDNEGNTSTTEVILTIAEHPNVRGTAIIQRDWKHSTAGAIVNALLWIPPFTIVKAIQLIFDRNTPDLVVGDPAFDAMFKVHSESVALAQQAIPEAARRYLVESNFDGMIVARPGALIYRLDGARVDAESVLATLDAALPLIEAFSANTDDHPMR